MNIRHKHHWLPMAGDPGRYECVCGATATLTDTGLRVQPKRRRKVAK